LELQAVLNFALLYTEIANVRRRNAWRFLMAFASVVVEFFTCFYKTVNNLYFLLYID